MSKGGKFKKIKSMQECHDEAMVYLNKSVALLKIKNYDESRKAARLAWSNLDMCVIKQRENQ